MLDGFDVEVHELVRVHLAQAIEHAREHRADQHLLDLAAVLADVVVQGAAALELHDHVHRAVGAEEVEHPHHVRMHQLGERAAFLEEALHAVAEGEAVLLADLRFGLAFLAQGERVGQVFLDRHGHAMRVAREIDDREAAQRQLPLDAVLVELKPRWQRAVGFETASSRALESLFSRFHS